MDFYDVEVVSGAKFQLIEDIDALKSSSTTVKFPYVPRRRDDENRLSREIDDILSLFTFLDEHKLLNMLPRYVADNPDAMPPIRLYEGELNGIVSMIKRLAEKVDEYSLALSIVSRDLQLLQARCVDQAPTCMCDQQQRQPTDRTSVVSNKTTEQPPAGNVPEWAVLASTPYAHVNRFDLLKSTDEDEHSDAPGHGDSYTAVLSRRGRRRARQQSSTNQAAQQQQQERQDRQQQQQPVQPARTRARVMFGKSVNSDVKIAAAKQMRKKAVFCIDNVSTDCSVEDIKSFVSGLSVQVLTCFEVRSRRRRGDDEDISDRKAFRLCIYDEDHSRLLDDSVWPHSVAVSEWYFRPKTQERAQQEQQVDKQVDKRRKVATEDQRTSPVVAASDSLSVSNAPLQTTVSDDTILANYMECSDTVSISDGGAAC